MNIVVKFNRKATAAARRKTVEFARKNGATKVEPLLPGDPDPDAKLMFLVEVATAAEGKKLIGELGGRGDVEYAEKLPQRHPRPD